jgi:uncharacterized membrane protein (GlpM family)
MSEEMTDRIKSFVIGIVFPLFLTCAAVARMTYNHTRFGSSLTPLQAFGYGLWPFGMALCIHAFFYQRYDNHPGIKGAVIAVGVVSLVLGTCLRFR